jgi:hypothetical protein
MMAVGLIQKEMQERKELLVFSRMNPPGSNVKVSGGVKEQTSKMF